MTAAPFRVNAPQVIHESIDGEVIIINLTSGNYYSLKGSGADVWALIEQSSSIFRDDLAGALELRFDASRSDIDGMLDGFLADLRAEGLVTEAGPTDDRLALAPPDGARQPFTAPRLEKYTDMQDLVLLDPVHEVDATGWPATAADAAVSRTA